MKILYSIFFVTFNYNFIHAAIDGHTIDFCFGFAFGWALPLLPFLLLSFFKKIRLNNIFISISQIASIAYLFFVIWGVFFQNGFIKF